MDESNNIQLSLKNSLAKISFCDKECFNVNNNKTKEQILKHITKTFGIQVIDKQYVNLNPHMVRNITLHEHLLSTFTNGNPYIFWLTKIDDMPHCIFIDRKLKDGYSYPKIHVVNYKFAEPLFEKDTIFTGELVKDVNRNWQYLISDILVFNGQQIKNKNALARFQLIYDIMDNQFTPDIMADICQIYVKRLFQYSDIKYIFNEFMPALSYVCKGLVFYTMNTQFSNYCWVLPKEDQIQVKRKHEADEEFFRRYPEYLQHKNIFENHQPYLHADDNTATHVGRQSSHSSPNKKEEHFAYLNIVKTDIPDIYNLYTKDDKLNRHSIAFIPNLSTSKMLYSHFKTISSADSIEVVAKCRYHYYFKRWIPVEITEKDKKKMVFTTQALTALAAELQAGYTGESFKQDD
jgi:hypothetical protein